MPQTATNPKTGERVVLIGNRWVPFQKTATNKETGEQVAYAGGRWIPIGAPKEESSWTDAVTDPLVGAVQGFLGVTKSITDVAGADNVVSRKLAEANDYVGQFMSAAERQDMAEGARIMKEAEGKGIGAEVMAGLQSFMKSPATMLGQGAGSLVPFVAAALGTAATGGGAPAAFAVTGALGAASGAGTIKGSVYDAVKARGIQEGLPKDKAEELAVRAQEYGGENLDQILVGSALGALASSTGITRGVIGKVISGAAKEVAEGTAKKGFLRHVGTQAVEEAVPEALQGGQERLAQNLAQQREGYEQDTWAGVAGQAAQEGVIGGILGGAASPFSVDSTYTPPPEPGQEEQQVPGEQPAPGSTAATPSEAAIQQRMGEYDFLGNETLARHYAMEDLAQEAKAAEEEAKAKAAEPVGTAPDETEEVGAEAEAAPLDAPTEAHRIWSNPTEMQKYAKAQGMTFAEADEYLRGISGFAPGMTLQQARALAHKQRREAEMAARSPAEQGNVSIPDAAELNPVNNITPPTPAVQPQAAPAAPAPVPEAAPVAAPDQPAPAPAPVAAAPEATSTTQPVGITPKDALAEANRRYPDAVNDPVEDQKATAFYNGVTGQGDMPISDDPDLQEQFAIAYAEGQKFTAAPNPAMESGAAPLEVQAAPAQEVAEDEEAPPPGGFIPAQDVEGVQDKPATLATKLFGDFNREVGALLENNELSAPEAGDVRKNLAYETADRPSRNILKQIEVAEDAARAADSAFTQTKNAKDRAAAAAEVERANKVLRGLSERLLAPARELLEDTKEGRRIAAEEAKGKLAGAKEIAKAKEAEVADRQAVANAMKPIADAMKRLSNLEYEQAASENKEVYAKRIVAAKKMLASAKKTHGKALRAAIQKAKMDPKTEVSPESLAELQHALSSETAPARTGVREAKIEVAESKLTKHHAKVKNIGTEADRTAAEIKGKDFMGLAKWAVDAAHEADHRAIASAVLRTLNQLQQLGTRFSWQILTDDSDVLKGNNALTQTDFSRQKGGDLGVHVILNGPGNANPGTTHEIILHELIHSALVALKTAIRYNPNAFKDTEAYRAYQALENVYHHFMAELELRKGLWEDGEYTPQSEFEEQLFKGEVNAGNDIDEFLTWSMSNRDMQKYTAGMNYNPRYTIWDKFVQFVKQALGINNVDTTVLGEVLRAGEGLLNVSQGEQRRILQLAPRGVVRSVAAKKPTTTSAVPKAKAGKKRTPKKRTPKMNAAKVTGALNKVALTTEVADIAAGIGAAINGHDSTPIVEKLGVIGGGLGSLATQQALNVMPTSGIIGWVGDRIPTLNTIVDHVRNMVAMKESMLRAAAPITSQLKKFTKAFGDRTLFNATAEARINAVSPTDHATRADALKDDKPLNWLRNEKASAVQHGETALAKYRDEQIAFREKQINQTYDAWEALGQQPGGQALYKMMRSFHEKMHKLNMRILDASTRSQLGAQAASELQALRKKMETGKASPNKRSKDDYLHDVPPNLFTKDYFPFVRRGKYYVQMKGNDALGVPPFFASYTNIFERNAAWNHLQKKYATAFAQDPTLIHRGDDIADLADRITNESDLMKKVLAVIDKNTQGKQALREAMYEVYLTTTPERSVQRKFMQAKETPGMSTDVLHTFADRSAGYANQISRLQYAGFINKSIESAFNALRNNTDNQTQADRDFAQLALAEIKKRAEYEINPAEQSAFVNFINRASFIYYLTSGATALIQTTAIPIRVMPHLWSKYGFAEGTKMWGKYMNFFKMIGMKDKDKRYSMHDWSPNVVDSKLVKNNPLLARAARRGQEMGILDTTADVLAQSERAHVEGKRHAIKRTAQTVSDVMSFAFTTTENVTRQAAFMMGFELEHKKLTAENKGGKKSSDEIFEEAVQNTARMLENTMGTFSSFERPTLLKNEVARAVFLFKMYSVVQTRFMAGTIYKAAGLPYKAEIKELEAKPNLTAGEKKKLQKLKEDRAQLRRDALKEFGSVTMMAGLFGGVAGMPLYTLSAMALSALMKGFEDDDDELRRLAKGDPLVANDWDWRFRNEVVPSVFGHGTVTGLDGRQHRLNEVIMGGPLSALTDVNLGSRTSLDVKNLWFRDVIAGKNSWETAFNFAASNIAPLSLVKQLAEGMDEFGKGEINRGVEKVVPAFAKGAAQAYRFGTEGAETTSGREIMGKEEFSSANLILQAVGLQSQRYGDLQRGRVLSEGQEEKANTQRERALRKLNEAFAAGANPDEVREAVEGIKEHNREYPVPRLAIDMNAIKSSWRAYQRGEKTNYRGVSIGKKDAWRLRSLQQTAPLE